MRNVRQNQEIIGERFLFSVFPRGLNNLLPAAGAEKLIVPFQIHDFLQY